MNNKYYKRWEISEAKFRQLARLFAMDLTATDAAKLAGLSRRSAGGCAVRLLAGPNKKLRWPEPLK